VQKPQKISWRPDTQVRIGEFLADPASNEISAAGKTTRLRPILMDVLLRLAADAGSAVNRETLLNDVWPRRMVNDEVLSRAIAELRTALGDDPKHPRYIDTLPKIGYRLIASVKSTAQSSDLLLAAGAIPASVPEAADATADTSSTPAPPQLEYPCRQRTPVKRLCQRSPRRSPPRQTRPPHNAYRYGNSSGFR